MIEHVSMSQSYNLVCIPPGFSVLFFLFLFLLTEFVFNDFTIAVWQYIVTEISLMLTHKLSDCFWGWKGMRHNSPALL